MATNQTAGQVPAYESVAPPAYNPSGQGASDAQPAIDNDAAISYPQIQGQANATPAAAPSGGGAAAAAPVAGQGMAMTQMLSNPNAPNVAQGQQVIYMMQQPDGTLVPLQNVQAVNGVATGVNVNSFGEGIQAPAPVVQPHAAVVQASRPGFILEAYYNTRMLSWGLLLLWIFYICQIYGSTVNELTVYDDGVHEWGFEYRTDNYYGYYWYDDLYYYDELCDYGDDTYCDLETRGETFEAFATICDIVGLVCVICLSNIMAKCCCFDHRNVKNQLNVVKGGVIIMLLCNIIAVMTWEVGNPLYDDFSGDDKLEWGTTIWLMFINIFGYAAVLACIFQKKK